MRRSCFNAGRSLAVTLALLASAAFAACGGGGKTPGSDNTSLVTLSKAAAPSGATGVAYSHQFTAEFAHGPGIFVVKGGALPLGLKLDKATGVVDGYPRQTGTAQFEIEARDGLDTSIPQARDANYAADVGKFKITIALGLPHILPQQPPSAQYRSSYQYDIDVAGGTAPYTFAQTGGTLPAGITVSPQGVIGSFPTQALQHPYNFQVTVTDSLGKTDVANLTLDVVVLPLIILTSSPIQSGAQGFAYDFPLDLASAGGGQPITWSQLLIDPVTNLFPAGDTLLSTIGMEIANVAGQGRFRVAIPNPGPTTLGTFFFTAKVTDEAAQIATRRYSFTVGAGPQLISINPNKQVNGAPITLTGLNFQAGAVVIFKPGLTQVQVTPNMQTTTTMTLNAAPASPGGGFVTVRVKNPDGGFSDLPSAYAFPATTMAFSASAVFPSPNSGLSSTGLDVGDINKDGFADFVHCGSNTTWRNASGNAAGVDLMLNAPPGGVFSAGTPTFTRVQLATAGDWYDVKLSDVNADSYLDVVAVGNPTGSASVRVWLQPAPIFPATGASSAQWSAVVPQTTTLNSSTGQFAASYGYPAHVAGLAVGKITTDAFPDIAYTQQDYTGFSSTPQYGGNGGRVSTMKGTGSGGFSGLATTGQTVYYSSTANGVGILTGGTRGNVVITDADAGFSVVWTGYGAAGEAAHFSATNTSDLFGTWTSLVKPGTYATECLCAATGDVNGDGIMDVVVPSGPTFYGGGAPGLTAFQSNGTTFTAVQATSGSSGAQRFATIFDIDFDNVLDSAVTVASNRVDFFKGRTASLGLQFKTSVQVLTNSPNVSRVGAGDFDKDGRIDVCVCTSFLADNSGAVAAGGYANAATSDRGLGGVQGVFILLNTSN